jgi:hypothetical protein
VTLVHGLTGIPILLKSLPATPGSHTFRVPPGAYRVVNEAESPSRRPGSSIAQNRREVELREGVIEVVQLRHSQGEQ